MMDEMQLNKKKSNNNRTEEKRFNNDYFTESNSKKTSADESNCNDKETLTKDTLISEAQKRALSVFQEDCSEENLWQVIIAFQGYPFRTATGLPFRYSLKVGKRGGWNKELVIDRRERSKTLAWSSVRLAFMNARSSTGVVSRPKALGDIRGVSYIYPMLWKFGVIEVPEKVREKMEGL